MTGFAKKTAHGPIYGSRSAGLNVSPATKNHHSSRFRSLWNWKDTVCLYSQSVWTSRNSPVDFIRLAASCYNRSVIPCFQQDWSGSFDQLAFKRQYATGLFQQVCYSLTKWTDLLLYVNSLRQLGKINSLQQICDISGRVNSVFYPGYTTRHHDSRWRRYWWIG